MIRTELKYNQLGVGSLVLPEDVDRTDYINRVYTLGQAAIHVPDIGIIQVALGVNILDYIEFPETSESFGSLISYYKMPVYNRYVAFAVLKKINDDSILNEYSFRLGKRKAGSVVEVIGNANSSDLFVNVSSNESGKGKLTINIVNNDDTAELDVKVAGEVKLEAKSTKIQVFDEMEINFPISKGVQTNIKYKVGKGLTYIDEFENEVSITKDKIKTKSDKYNIMTDDYSVKDLLDEILDGIATATVTTSVGEMPLKVKLAELKNKVKSIFE